MEKEETELETKQGSICHSTKAYLFLKEQFVFFDYSRPTLYFIVDYIAMICLFASVGYFTTRMLQ